MRGFERERRQITACSCTSLLSSCSLSMSCDKMWFIAFAETNDHRHVGLSMACISGMCVWGSSNMCLCGLVGPATCASVCKLMNVFQKRTSVFVCVLVNFHSCLFWDGSSFKAQSSGSRQIAVENIEHYLSHYKPQLSNPLQHSHLL